MMMMETREVRQFQEEKGCSLLYHIWQKVIACDGTGNLGPLTLGQPGSYHILDRLCSTLTGMERKKDAGTAGEGGQNSETRAVCAPPTLWVSTHCITTLLHCSSSLSFHVLDTSTPRLYLDNSIEVKAFGEECHIKYPPLHRRPP